MSGLDMLVCTGEWERTEAGFAALLTATGLRLTGVTEAGRGYSVLRGVPA